MPRLLSLNTYHYRRGGSDAVYFDHSALFEDAGWETAFFAMDHPRNESTAWSRYFVDELEFGFDYSLGRKLVMAGKVIYSLEARKKLDQLLKVWRPNVAHAHCIYHHLSPSVLSLLRGRGIPAVMTAHDLKIACPAYNMLNSGGICERCKNGNLLHVVLNRCLHDSLPVSALVMVESTIHKLLGLYRKNLDRIVVPSQFYQKKLIEWGWPRDQLVYIPNFIDIGRYTPGHGNHQDYVLYFGRLAAVKGVETLIRAGRAAGLRVVIAGAGPHEDHLKKVAEDDGGEIEFTGYCSGDKLKKLIAEARAVVLPSEWYENAPISILESYASGKIVVGANIGGIPEMIEDGTTGYLFESGNIDDLVAVLARVRDLSDAELAEMGRRARHHVETRFTRDRYLRDMLQLYREIGVDISEEREVHAPHCGNTSAGTILK